MALDQGLAAEDGRLAAERLSDEWPNADWIPAAPTVHWARAAVERLAELIREQRAIFRASQQKSERGAARLSPRPFQGLIESLQNADDLGATQLKIAIRRSGGKSQLLIAHDGARVMLQHIGAMVLPWLTTKEGDANASGRFGIGQQTLRALGGPIEVHCEPFHVRMGTAGPHVCAPAAAIPNFYAPQRLETLLVVPLNKTVDPAALSAFVADVGSRSLLFLKSVRRVSMVNLLSGRRTVDHRLIVETQSQVRVAIGTRTRLPADKLELRDPKSGRRFRRYTVERPLTADEQRYDKATGPTTLLGFAMPLGSHERGNFFDRLPMPIETGFPFSLSAQFDPDAARTTIVEGIAWNERRLADLGDLVVASALDSFASDPPSGWTAVPLAGELAPLEGRWLGDRIRSLIVDHAQHEIAARLRLDSADLSRLVYEDPHLDGLITSEDLESLRPGMTALNHAKRDGSRRWRAALAEIGVSSQVPTAEALALFDQSDEQLGQRAPEWYVAMAHAALATGLFDDLITKRSVLLADGARIAPPSPDDPVTLVRVVDAGGLAESLGVARAIHPAYLSGAADARAISEALRDEGMLVDEIDSAEAILGVLERGESNTFGRVRVRDAQLLALRDAFERLDEDRQRTLGFRVGRNVELRCHTFDPRGQQVEEWLSPTEAYLPSAIDKESDSFAHAAATTPGLSWLDPAYARLLRRSGGRRELGAQRFLARLGAAIGPRLERPSDEFAPWRRDTRPASRVSDLRRPDIQMREIGQLSRNWQRYLLNDRWSPDMNAVIADIDRDRNARRRRRRGLALLGVLVRGWDRTYADHTRATAVWAYDGYWRDPADVIATWLAVAATGSWLPSASGAMRPPSELCLPTEASRLAYGDRKSMFLARVDSVILRSPALEALRLRRAPSASELVAHLGELQSSKTTTRTESEATTAYHLLALHCEATGAAGTIDDMSSRDLRQAFARGRGRSGLVFVDRQWLAPRSVFRGERIFGRHRPFVARNPELQALWLALEIREPSVADCFDIVHELSQSPLDPADRGTVLQIMRSLASQLSSMPAQVRSRLRRLPLWTGQVWRSHRPVYVFDDERIREQTSGEVPSWQSGFSSYVGLEDLLQALAVTRVMTEDFSPIGLDAHAVVSGDNYRPQFALAIEHLRDELARGDQALYESLSVGWSNLAAAQLIVKGGLRLTFKPEVGSRVEIQADAHVIRSPLVLLASSPDALATAAGAGSAIASLFSPSQDRQKVAWAWVTMWQRAGDGQVPQGIILSEDEPTREGGAEGTNRLIQLRGQAVARGKSRKGVRPGTKSTHDISAITVQPLKDIYELEPDEGTLINEGKLAGGVIFPARKPRQATEPDKNARDQGTRRTPTRTVPAPVTDREQLAFDAVQRALRLDPDEIVDLRRRHGIGADAVDQLRQFYEIKMETSGEFPQEVTLQRSQVDAAQDGEDFFLAVVSGLSADAKQLRVRFIFKPLEKLAVRIRGEATLSGVRDVEALQFSFRKSTGT